MAGDFKPKPRDKNLLDSKRLTLSVPCPVKGVKGWSTLYYFANNDNPGITVYTGDPNDKGNNYGRIQAKFGLADLQTHLVHLNKVLNSKEAVKYECVCDSIRGQDKRPVPVARVEVGKRPDGVVYICVEDLEIQGRPIIHFSFAPTRFHHFARNGEPLSEAELSQDVARGWYEFVKAASIAISVATYKHPEPKQQQGGGGGYRGNGGGNSGGGYNNNGNRGSYGGGNGGGGRSYGESETASGASGSDLDEDIPF